VVLSATMRAPELGLSQSQLAEGMGIGAPALIRHIDRLEKLGLVSRRRDETDRRVTRITVTPDGKRLRRRLEKVMVARDRELRDHLGDDERDALVRALRTIYDFAVTDGASVERSAS
jgi:DNA-binding MarR family transcriptional regulator